MSGRHLSCSDTYSRQKPPSNFLPSASTQGWPHNTGLTRANSLKYPRSPCGPHCSDHSSPVEKFNYPSSIMVKKICMGQPYKSKCVETSNVANCHHMARKPASGGNPQYLPCTKRPTDPSSPTFLDQLIKGINYLDRSTSAFCKKSPLNLPKLAVNCLERAANSMYQGRQEHTCSRSYSNASSSLANEDISSASTCMVSVPREARALEYVDNASNTSCSHQFYSRKVAPAQPQRPGIKLPEVPLFGNGIFSLGQLPKFWEAIRSGWGAPETVSKPSSWW